MKPRTSRLLDKALRDARSNEADAEGYENENADTNVDEKVESDEDTYFKTVDARVDDTAQRLHNSKFRKL